MAAAREPTAVRAGGNGSDPTWNVLDLVSAATQRQDDLRAAETRHIHTMMELRAAHAEEMRLKESARIDAIRAVDVGAVQQAAQVSATQATTLATQVATSAETLRTQVAAAAQAAAVALAAALEPIQKDVADLRRAQYEAQGQKTQTEDTRASTGLVFGIAFGGAGILFSVIGLALAVLAR